MSSDDTSDPVTSVSLEGRVGYDGKTLSRLRRSVLYVSEEVKGQCLMGGKKKPPS